MKAISIKEPWASLIRDGRKSIETRTWVTNYRGDILLCASKDPKTDISGNAFAVAELYDIKPMTKKDEKAAGCKIYPRAQSWFLRNIRPIIPFEIQGRLGIFDTKINPEDLNYYG